MRLLAELVSDEEDDELSKKAFTTMQDMDKSAADGLYPLIAAVGKSLCALTGEAAVDISAAANKQILLDGEEEKGAPTMDAEKFAALGQCKERLAKYLPIYNGLVYMNEGKTSSKTEVAVRMHALTKYGVAELVQTLPHVPLCFIPQILYVVSNLTIDKHLGKMVTLVRDSLAFSDRDRPTQFSLRIAERC